MGEIEEQRNGRNKETTINHKYIGGGEYRKKFDSITENTQLRRLLYQLSKDMLFHRTGTVLEDMYWVDLDSMRVVAKEVNSLIPKKIVYSDATQKIIKAHDNLLTIHTHPDSFPPSIDDLNSNYDHSYVVGIVICHDGRIYMYSANERIHEDYYKLVVERFIKSGYNEDEAQVAALLKIQQNFDINFKEVTADGSI
jgi:hypothetical protein